MPRVPTGPLAASLPRARVRRTRSEVLRGARPPRRVRQRAGRHRAGQQRVPARVPMSKRAVAAVREARAEAPTRALLPALARRPFPRGHRWHRWLRRMSLLPVPMPARRRPSVAQGPHLQDPRLWDPLPAAAVTARPIRAPGPPKPRHRGATASARVARAAVPRRHARPPAPAHPASATVRRADRVAPGAAPVRAPRGPAAMSVRARGSLQGFRQLRAQLFHGIAQA